MTKVRKSLFFSLIERYFSIFLALVSGVVVSRILRPEDIGLYSLAASFIGLAQVLRDFGASTFIIQTPSISQADIESAFGVSLCIGVLLFLLVIGASPLAAYYFHDQRLQSALGLLALNFLIVPLGAPAMSLLTREMRFDLLFWINSGAAIAGFVVTVVSAMQGMAFFSLIFGALALNITTSAGCLAFRRSHIVLRPSLRNWRKVARVGSHTTSAQIFITAGGTAIESITGRLFGFATLAQLSRAQGLMNVFHQDISRAIRSVAFPALSEANRNDHGAENAYLRLVVMMTVFGWPFYAFLATFSLPVVRLMYGEQWHEAASLAPFFCLAGSIAVLWNMIPAMFAATGKTEHLPKMELWSNSVRLAIVGGGLLVFPRPAAMPIFLSISFLFSAIFFYVLKQRYIGNNWAQWKSLVGKSALVSCATMLPAWIGLLLMYLFDLHLSDVMVLLLGGLLCLISWLAALKLLRHPLVEDKAFIALEQKCFSLMKAVKR